MTPPVLIVEDDPAIGELLQFTLESKAYKTRRAASAEDAIQAVREFKPLAAIVDWMLPGVSGLALVAQLRRDPRLREVPLIMLTARGGEDDRVRGLESGADDFLAKPFSPRELIARLEALIRRRVPHLASTPSSVGPFHVDPGSHQVLLHGQRLPLRMMEYRLLRLLLANPNRIFSREQLIDAVWGEHVAIEERTVDVHMRRLRLALGDVARSHLATVRSGGYMFQLPVATDQSVESA